MDENKLCEALNYEIKCRELIMSVSYEYFSIHYTAGVIKMIVDEKEKVKQALADGCDLVLTNSVKGKDLQ